MALIGGDGPFFLKGPVLKCVPGLLMACAMTQRDQRCVPGLLVPGLLVACAMTQHDQRGFPVRMKVSFPIKQCQKPSITENSRQRNKKCEVPAVVPEMARKEPCGSERSHWTEGTVGADGASRLTVSV